MKFSHKSVRSASPTASRVSEKRIREMANAKRRGPVAPAGIPHCRICGYTPRFAELDIALAEKILDHIERRHWDEFLGHWDEVAVLVGQKRGGDA